MIWTHHAHRLLTRRTSGHLPSSIRSRRELFSSVGKVGAGITLSSMLAACTLDNQGQTSSIGNPPNTRRLKAAFTNNDAVNSSWCAQGKRVAETWGKWFGVDITWYDGQASIDQQRKALDDISTKTWDFVAIQAVSADTLIEPVQRLLDNGIPVIQMDTEIDTSHSTNITTFLEPDNVFMGQASATALFEKMGGKGKVIMTQGQLGHTGAQKRATGFYQALAKYPAIELLAKDAADWDTKKSAQLWEGYLSQYNDIGGGFFHNDDMALAAAQVIHKAGRKIPFAGVDAMPPAIQAVIDGSMVASVRNPAGRIHWGALMIGIQASNGSKNIPSYILADGPVVTQSNGPGLIYMEDQFIL